MYRLEYLENNKNEVINYVFAAACIIIGDIACITGKTFEYQCTGFILQAIFSITIILNMVVSCMPETKSIKYRIQRWIRRGAVLTALCIICILINAVPTLAVTPITATATVTAEEGLELMPLSAGVKNILSILGLNIPILSLAGWFIRTKK